MYIYRSMKRRITQNLNQYPTFFSILPTTVEAHFRGRLLLNVTCNSCYFYNSAYPTPRLIWWISRHPHYSILTFKVIPEMPPRKIFISSVDNVESCRGRYILSYYKYLVLPGKHKYQSGWENFMEKAVIGVCSTKKWNFSYLQAISMWWKKTLWQTNCTFMIVVQRPKQITKVKKTI